MLHEAIFLATCNATMTNKKLFKLQRICYTQATCLATLRKVEGRSTFLATRNATIAVATREFFLATCNATFVALQVARKIDSCNMALRSWANEDTFRHIVADTLLLMVFLRLRKLGNICCGHRMFLNKIRNISCVPDTKFLSATNVARAGKRGNICVGNKSFARTLFKQTTTATATRTSPNKRFNE